MTQQRSALILGATGAVGKSLLGDILKARAFERVVCIGRREFDVTGLEGTDLLIQKKVDFEKLEDYKTEFREFSHAFCCLGTTRADAGSDEAFIRIDHDYVINSAKLIAEQNPMSSPPKDDGNEATEKDTAPASAVHFLYCSAANADPSSLFLYPRTKGLIEKDLSSLRFSRLSIFQPGGLEGSNREKPRLLETIFTKFFYPVINLVQPRKYTVPVTIVARSMLRYAVPNGTGDVDESKDNNKVSDCMVERISNLQIYEIAGKE